MKQLLKDLAIVALEHGFTVRYQDWDNKLLVSDDDGSILTDNMNELKKWMGY